MVLMISFILMDNNNCEITSKKTDIDTLFLRSYWRNYNNIFFFLLDMTLDNIQFYTNRKKATFTSDFAIKKKSYIYFLITQLLHIFILFFQRYLFVCCLRAKLLGFFH